MATPIPKNRAPLTAWFIAAATGGRIARLRDEDAVAFGITTDSRAVTKGSAFVALRGENSDGHAYLEAAVASGASLLVIEAAYAGRARSLDVDVVEVEDTRAAWGAIARAHLASWRRARGASARVVAITGSAGKTTTKEITAALLEACDGQGGVLATAGNLNNLIGLPAVALTLTPEHAFAVLEAGMSVPGEIARLARIAQADVAVITNCGLAHGEGVGGRQGVAREKGALYEALAPEGIAIVNADDPAASGQLARTPARRAFTFGRAKSADYRLVERTPKSVQSARIRVLRPTPRGREALEVDLPWVGEAQAIDFVAALAAAEAASGQSLDEGRVARALQGLRVLDGRASVKTLRDGTRVLDDSYNANPESMRAALATLQELSKDLAASEERGKRRRMVAILGEMKELGEGAERVHDELGAQLARAGVALAIGCGGLASRALDRAAKEGVTVVRCETTDEAAIEAVARVQPGDAVLAKGSRSVKLEKVIAALLASREPAAQPAARREKEGEG